MMLLRLFSPSLGRFKRRKMYREDKADFYRNKNALVAKSVINNAISRTSSSVFKTQKRINFYGIAFGSTLKACKKKMGKPNYHIKKTNVLEGQQILFYRLRIAKVKCVLQLHFFNDQFFFGQLSLKHNTGYISDDLVKIVREKYGLPDNKDFELIEDDKQNQIEFLEGMAPCIRYTSGDEPLLAEIRTALYSAHRKHKIKQVRQEEMLLDLV